MRIKGWLIVGGDGHGLWPSMYVGAPVGALPDAANFKAGQWMLWRPVATIVAGVSTQHAIVCVSLPMLEDE